MNAAESSHPQPPPSPPDPAAFDEIARATNGAAEVYASIQSTLFSEGPDELRRLSARGQQMMRDLGVTFNLYDDDTSHDRVVPVDLFPRVIDPREWSLLAAGIAQRIRVWNAFFKDIHASQEILRNGVLPHEIVYDDPHYQRNAVGLTVPEDTFVHVAAFDLARDHNGRWVVIEDYVSNTTGASYALQARHAVSQVSPELVELANIHPISGYPTALLEHLRCYARRATSEPRVVLLSPGLHNQAYYEHSYLARQMGIPLVTGSDLIVLNSEVFLKTIGGLEPIDVIYRRLDEDYIDPLAFREDSRLGVPGLMNCVRKGTVTITNAAGTALGNNRALAAYVSRMARFYLNETLLIPTVERLLCRDRDQCEQVLGALSQYRVLQVSERAGGHSIPPNPIDESALGKLRNQLLANPARHVAEPHLPFDCLPSLTDSGLQPRHTGLRLFAFGSQRPHVHPIALTRFSTSPDSQVISSGLGGGIKDTWILRDDEPGEEAPPITVASPQRRLRLGSRIADNLFWVGRYAERAENTARILRALQSIQLEDQTRQSPESWVPLWEALARATGHSTHFFKRSSLRQKQTVSHYLLLDRKNPSSVIRCIELCRLNAHATRETVPPEVWIVINRLHQTLTDAMPPRRTKLSDHEEWPLILELIDRVLNQLDSLIGSASKNMLRDDGWHFWSLGACIERAVTTVLVVRQVLLKRQGDRTRGERDASNLDALLRMLSSQYAYRSLYQARPTLQNAATMLLQDPQLPRSVLYCLLGIRGSLERVFGRQWRAAGHHESSTPLRHCARLISEVEFAD
ncbi:MAG TPA: circularly permuted type 2 ATP-grasp protein, partial [Methylomirabilota bacterium]|nr:circularly permuted type 2 ATP-grasp protein [Methylomirabilota bacterium]